jgi:hypothetical protein
MLNQMIKINRCETPMMLAPLKEIFPKSIIIAHYDTQLVKEDSQCALPRKTIAFSPHPLSEH